MNRPHIQFTLVHGIVAVSLICAVLGVFDWVGLRGLLVLGYALVIAALCLGFAIPDRRCLVVGGVLTLVCACLTPTRIDSGFGTARLTCMVHVVDASGDPVNGATVRIRQTGIYHPNNRPKMTIPAGEPGVSGKTDAEGMASLEFLFFTSPERGIFADTIVYISPDLWIQVEAPGCQREVVRMDTIVGHNYDWRKLPLPPMRIQLERVGQREAP